MPGWVHFPAQRLPEPAGEDSLESPERAQSVWRARRAAEPEELGFFRALRALFLGPLGLLSEPLGMRGVPDIAQAAPRVGPEEWSTDGGGPNGGARWVEGLKGAGPKGWGPKGWGAQTQNVGPEGWEPQISRFFCFSSPAANSCLLSPGGSSRGIVVAIQGLLSSRSNLYFVTEHVLRFVS